MATRNGSAEWKGDLKGGAGTVKVGEGAWEGSYSFTSRFEEGEGTNPEELIAAGHASCFAMALSHIMSEDGQSPESVKTSAAVHLRVIDGQPTIARIELTAEGSVPGIDEDQFRSYAEEAKAGCPVSRALGAVPEIELDARLV